MFRHHDIPDNTKPMSAANFIQDFHKLIPRLNRSKQRSSPIATEGDEMQIALSVMTFERIAHREKIKARTLKTEGCGTPSILIFQLQKWYTSLVRHSQEEENMPAPPADTRRAAIDLTVFRYF